MMLEPVDQIHADCLAARDDIRRHVHRIRTQINAWEPKPYPTHPHTTQNGNDQ